MTSNKEICLGTIKLGIPDYGFSSSDEKLGINALEFLKQVGELGITKFDTSPRYRESEKILGRYIKQSKHTPFVSSKIDNLKPNNPESPKEMVESVKNSLNNLNKEYLDITDVTLITGYSASTIRRRIIEGRLKCMQNVPNGRILFKRSMIESWLGGNR